ncbi:hypothetical protein LOAG_15558 [Loa loa]|uniref:Uncharacterized protein n=1 Tax=Loa loa TaxID=7209 RepID=A0A1S0TFF5_LOALO|nr:hypothetical protein LOAG_15558 [Loa loa]EFO12973.1 hypothetical protein LOAG_15558 [Loa loa]
MGRLIVYIAFIIYCQAANQNQARNAGAPAQPADAAAAANAGAAAAGQAAAGQAAAGVGGVVVIAPVRVPLTFTFAVQTTRVTLLL